LIQIWDGDGTAYFVGFQVDLLNNRDSDLDRRLRDPETFAYNSPSAPFLDNNRPLSAPEPSPSADESEILSLVRSLNSPGADNRTSQDEELRRRLEELLVDCSDELVHVLSLKGTILHVSPSCTRLTGFTPADLLGQPVDVICYPADHAPLLRELKKATHDPSAPVELLYRLRIKHRPNKFVWIDARGKLLVEQGKGKKCVALIGRPRQPHRRLPWSDLRAAAGLGQLEL
jgi:PAS domain S-box-containing protein